MAEYFRVERTEGFSIMSVFHLRDKTLSMRAKGLLCFILQLPADWKFSTRGLAANMKDGVDAVTETLRELERANYISRRRLRDEKGHYKDTMYTIYEKPRTIVSPDEPTPTLPSVDAAVPDAATPDLECPDPEIPYQENPDLGLPDEVSPDMASPAQENPALLNMNRPNTNKPRIKRESTGSIRVMKSDSATGAALAGAVFQLLDASFAPVGSPIMTDASGIAEWMNLSAGDYYVQEIEAPEGYVVDDALHSASITDNGQFLTIEMSNEAIVCKLRILKADADTQDVLSGAIFNVTDVSGVSRFSPLLCNTRRGFHIFVSVIVVSHASA